MSGLGGRSSVGGGSYTTETTSVALLEAVKNIAAKAEETFILAKNEHATERIRETAIETLFKESGNGWVMLFIMTTGAGMYMSTTRADCLTMNPMSSFADALNLPDDKDMTGIQRLVLKYCTVLEVQACAHCCSTFVRKKGATPRA